MSRRPRSAPAGDFGDVTVRDVTLELQAAAHDLDELNDHADTCRPCRVAISSGFREGEMCEVGQLRFARVQRYPRMILQFAAEVMPKQVSGP